MSVCKEEMTVAVVSDPSVKPGQLRKKLRVKYQRQGNILSDWVTSRPGDSGDILSPMPPSSLGQTAMN